MPRSDRMALNEGLTWLVLGLGLVFALLALLFLARPDLGGLLFGIAAKGGEARAYVRAVAIRDLALAFYLFALVGLASRRAVAVLLAVTVVIPLCDLGLLVWETGGLTPVHALLHEASALVFAGLSACVFAADAKAARRGT